MFRVKHALLLFSLFTQHSVASQIIATVDYDVQGQFVMDESCNAFTFTIGHAGSHVFGDVLLTPWPAPFSWENGFSGSFDFSYSFDQPPFFHFTRMIESITDGIDEPMFFKGDVWDCNRMLPPSPYFMESTLFQLPTDLIGNNIESIQLRINNLDLELIDQETMFDLSTTYEFWGTPVPEPASLALLALPLALSRRHKLR